MEVARCLVIHVLFASRSCLWREGGGEDGGQAKQADCVKERPDVHSQDGGWKGKLQGAFAECFLCDPQRAAALGKKCAHCLHHRVSQHLHICRHVRCPGVFSYWKHLIK